MKLKALLKRRHWSARSKLVLGLLLCSIAGQAQNVNVNATAGTTSGSYATLNAAFTAINAGTHQGVIDIAIVGNTTEPATPVPLLKSDGTTSIYSSITIKPSGGDFVISSAAAPVANRAFVELAGADNVTIDGDDPATPGTRNLSFVAAPVTTAGVGCIRLSSNSTTGTDGADNITVKNCIITGARNSSTSTTVSYGIQFSNGVSTTSATAGAYSSINTVIENNVVTRCYYAIHAVGASATYPNTGTQILNNILGTDVNGYSDATSIGSRGIYINYSATPTSGGSAIIRGNDYRGGGASAYSGLVVGIYLEVGNYGIIVEKNNIHDLSQPTTGGYGPLGIYISGISDQIKIRNNFIANLVGYTYSTSATAVWSVNGIYISAAATNLSIDHNTIALNGAISGTTANHATSAIVFTSSTATLASLQNNIIVNLHNSTGSYGLYCTATGNISGATVNNNNYYVPYGNVGYYSAARNSLVAWQTATSKDANSFNVLPPFVSTSDLHITPGMQTLLESGGALVSVTNISEDFDGELRPGPAGSVHGGGLRPDIGADEFDGMLFTCMEPGSVNIPSAGITHQSAVVNWSAPAITTPVYYEVYYSTSLSPAPTAGTTATVSNINALTTTLNLLSASTTYYVWVRSYCGGTDYSNWTIVDSFKTQCLPPSILTSTPAARCGTGTVELAATADAGAVLKWYDAASGGAVLGTGNTFTTPVLNSTTNFWVSGASGYLPPVQVGTGTDLTTATEELTAFSNRRTSYRMQLVYTVAELNALGFTGGDITGIGFDITTLGDRDSNTAFTVKIGTTSQNTLSNYINTGLNIVYGPVVHRHVIGHNVITLSSPYFWDGVSNLIVEISHNGANATNNARTYYTTTTGNTVAFGYNGAASSTNSDKRLNTKFYFEGCESPRTQVTATVNTAPAFTTTGNKTVCNNAITELTVTSSQSAYDNVVWTPITDLYTDAAATTPYVAGTHVYTVYHKSSNVGMIAYAAVANNTTTLCGAVDTLKIQTLPVSAVAVSSATSIMCVSGDATISLDGFASVIGAQYQWQQSTDNIVFTDIPGATNETYFNTFTATGYYRALVKNSDGNVCITSISDSVLVNNPQVLSTVPASRCGVGTVQLEATTGTGNTLNWYNVPTGGTAIATGNTFTTPVIGVTTDYWVSAAAGATSYTGRLVPAALPVSGNTAYTAGLQFNATQTFTLNSVEIYPNGASGTCNIQLQNSAGTVLDETGSITIPSGNGTVPYTVTLNFNVPVGTGLRLLRIPGTVSLGYESTWTGPQLLMQGATQVGEITNSYWYGTTTGYYFFYNWSIGADCEGSRTQVTATVTPSPAFTTTDSSVVCNNDIVPLTVTSTISNFDQYEWSPIDNLFTDAAATIPYTGGTANTVYFRTTAMGDYTIRTTANNTTTQCASIDSTFIKVLPGSVTITKTPASLCVSGSSTLSIPADILDAIQWQSASSLGGTYTDIPGATGNTVNTGTITSTTYYKLIARNSATNAVCFEQIDSIVVNNPQDPTVAGASRCGTGSVTLTATPNGAGNVNWYDAPAGGVVLYSGTTFVTPVVNTTTTFYATSSASASGMITLGNGAYTSNSGATTYSGTSPFAYHYGNYKHQILVTAAELYALGASAGNITSVAFDIASVGATPATFNNFNVTLIPTSLTALTSTFATGGSNVFSGNLTPAVGIFTINFTTPFPWDGVSNIIIQTCYNNNNSGEVARSAEVKYDSTAFISHNIYRADGTQNSVCTVTTGNVSNDGPITRARPKMIFGLNAACESNRIPVTVTVDPAPAISVTSSQSNVCIGSSTTLTASSANSGYTYTWTPGNLTGASVSVSPVSDTWYYVEALDNSGGTSNACRAVDSVLITTTVSPQTPNVTPASPRSICLGQSVTIAATAGLSGNVLTEDFEGVTPVFALNAGSALTATQSTTYYQQGAASMRIGYGNNLSGSDAYEQTQSVDISQLLNPKLKFWHIAAFEGSSTTVNVDYGIVDYSTDGGATWQGFPASAYRGAGILGTGGPNAGMVQFNRSAYSDWSTISSSSATPTNSQWKEETIDLSAFASSTQFKVRFRVKSDGSVIYYGWLLDDIRIGGDVFTDEFSWTGTPATNGLPGSAATPSTANSSLIVTPTAAGTYTYTATVHRNGCTATATTSTITVTSAITATLTANGSTTLCSTSGVVLNANTGTSYTYVWYKDGGIINGAGNASYTATTPGVYHVVITSSGCSGTSNTITITGGVPPAATMTASGSVNICQGDTVTFSAQPAGANYTYEWLKDGQLISGATAATYKAYIAGVYSVIVTEAGACRDTSATQIVTVTARPTPNLIVNGNILTTASGAANYQWYLNDQPIPGATTYIYSVTQSGTYKVCVTNNGCTGCSESRFIQAGNVADINVDAIHIYPNPAQDYITIDAPIKVNVSIRTVDGKEIMNVKDARTISLNGFADGMYMLYITDVKNDSIIKVQRLVKASK